LAEVTAGPTREEIDAQRASVAAAACRKSSSTFTTAYPITALSNGVVQTRKLAHDPGKQRSIVTLVNGRELDVFLELPEELGGSIAPGLPVTLAAPTQLAGRATLTGGSFC